MQLLQYASLIKAKWNSISTRAHGKAVITSGKQKMEANDEALEMLEDAKRGWLMSALDHGDPIPEPGTEQT